MAITNHERVGKALELLTQSRGVTFRRAGVQGEVWRWLGSCGRTICSDDLPTAVQGRQGAKDETARELCYRLYTLCERKKRANEAMAYNGLVQSWPEITRLAREATRATPTGTDDMFNQE